MRFNTLAGSSAMEMELGAQVAPTREVVIGETLSIGTGGELEVLSGPAVALVAGNTVRFAAPGRYTLRYAGYSFTVVACEPNVLDAILRTIRGQSHPSGGRFHHSLNAEGGDSPERARRVLRSLALHEPRFDGTRASLTPKGPPLNLRNYGA